VPDGLDSNDTEAAKCIIHRSGAQGRKDNVEREAAVKSDQYRDADTGKTKPHRRRALYR
jgi:hypothetical protein